MTLESTTVTRQESLGILFADVSGSTRLYEVLGDTKARESISRVIALMTQAAQKNGGVLIKTIGDEVMCRFPTADQTAAAALDMQESVAGAAIAAGGANLTIHVGFHYGPVVFENNDVFGDAVNLAARVVNLSKRDQILTTGETVAALSARWKQSTRQVDRAAVRGKEAEIDIYELVWQDAESTRIAGKAWAIPPAAAPGLLTVRLGVHELEVNEKHPSVTVGRGEQNDLVVHNDLASRLHARIDYRNQRFLLTDQSTNGTWITDASGAPRLVRHDSHVLTGSGTLCFGHKPEPGQTDHAHYALKKA